MNVDDVLLERNDQNRYGNFQFLGLALVFGAVGLITMFDGSTLTDTIVSNPSLNTGSGLRSSAGVTVEPCSMADESCNSDIVDQLPQEVDTFQNIQQAFYLLLEAFRALKFVNYVSFAISIGLIFLWIRSFFDVVDTHKQSRQRASQNQQ